MIDDPRFAPRREDLPFLRRRRRPRAPAVSPPAPTISFDRPDRHPVSPPTEPTISFDRPGRSQARPSAPAPARPPVPRPPNPQPPNPQPPAPLPSAPPPAVPAAAHTSSSLDLDAGRSTPQASSAPAVPANQSPAEQPPVAPRSGGPVAGARPEVRVAARQRVILTVAAPTVTLSRLQSAIGTLTVEAAVSAAVGDLRLGGAYELSSGYSSTVQLTDGNRFAPPRAKRPVIVASREHFERLAVDLRQSTDLRRLCVYAFSASRQPLQWGGTLIATTFGGAKVELPMEHLQGGNVATLLTLYNVRGEFVLRGELQSFNGGVRDAVRAYGYDRITWLDDRTPVE